MPRSTMGPEDEGSRGDLIDLGQLLSALRRRMGMILGVGLAACVASVAFVLLATPQFAGQSQLLLESRDSVYTRTLGQGETQANLFDEQAVQSQVQIVTSREVAREAIRRLGLVGHPDFDPLAGPVDPLTRIRALFGAASGALDAQEEDRIFDAYYDALTVYPVPRSRVIAVEFRASDPELAARAANVVAEIYLEQLESAKGELARAASNWLGANIDDLRDRVSRAERAVEDYRARTGLFTGGGSATITAQQLSDLNTRLAEARSTQADAEARARLIADMIRDGRAFEIPDVANNELIRRLIEQRIDLRSQIALEQRTLLPGHPRILELRAQLADLDAEIGVSAERTVRVLENEARVAGSRVEALEAALDAQMRVVAQANESEVQLRALEREARAEREQLEAYLARYREAVARGTDNASLPDARIVSRAVAPNAPVYPRKGPTVVLATLAGVFMAAGFVVVSELAFGGPPGPAEGRRGRRGRPEDMDDETAAAETSDSPGESPPARPLREVAALSSALAEPSGARPAPQAIHSAALDLKGLGARLRGSLAAPSQAEPVVAEAPSAQEASAAHQAPAAQEEPPETMIEPAPQPAPVAREASGSPAPAAAQETREPYAFDALLARLKATPARSRGRRVLVTGLGDPGRVAEFAEAFALSASRLGRAALVEVQPAEIQPAEARAPSVGLAELVAGEASFFEVIRRDASGDLHRIAYGSREEGLAIRDEDALDIAVSALAHTYDWLALSAPDGGDRESLAAFAGRADAIVVASDRDASDPLVAEFYAALSAAGEAEVLVAAVGVAADAAAA